MLWELRFPEWPRGSAGWILAKHPESTYERKMSRGRLVRGTWMGTAESAVYRLSVDMTGIDFVNAMRAQNRSNYVDVYQSVVSPHSLVCVRETFRSALLEHFDPQSTHHATETTCEALIGPWSCNVDAVRFFARTSLRLRVSPSSEHPRLFVFGTDTPMTVSSFLQRVYVVCMLATRRLHIGERGEWDDKMEALVAYTKSWPAAERDPWAQGLPKWARDFLYIEATTAEAVADALAEMDLQDEQNAAVLVAEETLAAPTVQAPAAAKTTTATTMADNAFAVVVVAKEKPAAAGSHDRAPATLHQRRHQWIVDQVREYAEMQQIMAESGRTDARRVQVVVDYGCAQGALSFDLDRALPPPMRLLFAVDATEYVRHRLRRCKRIVQLRANILYPLPLLERLLGEDLGARRGTRKVQTTADDVDVLVLTEVVEHLESADRRALIALLGGVLRPRLLIITTPNRSYNRFLPPLCANGWRHPDHRIEYGRDEWLAEVVRPLERLHGYQCTEERALVPADKMPPGADAVDDQPSFCACFHRAADAPSPVAKWKAHLGYLGATLFRPVSLPTLLRADIPASHVVAGVVAPEFVASCDYVFYRAPTMPPVEFCHEEPAFLEHPRAAFDYYRQRGVRALWAERKYMGSRAHVLAFASPEAAQRVGWTGPLLTVLSRSGRLFFSEGGCRLAEPPPAWLPFLQERMRASRAKTVTTGETTTPLDYLMLDAEILPWSLKGAELIARDFRLPGECALVSREFAFGTASGEAERARLFLHTLAQYDDEDRPIEMRVFQVLSMGRTLDDGRYDEVFRGDSCTSEDRYAAVDSVCEGGETCGIRPVQRFRVDLDDETSQQEAVRQWEAYCTIPTIPGDVRGYSWKQLYQQYALRQQDLDPCSGASNTGVQAYVCRSSGDLYVWNDRAVQWTRIPSSSDGLFSSEPVADHVVQRGGEGGEGFVFKTHPTLREKAPDGSLIQPMLKVRGRDYLRLIYGMDYLTPSHFALVKRRNVARKRLLAIQQSELGRMILDAFLAGDAAQCRQWQAAFCGEGASTVVDATL